MGHEQRQMTKISMKRAHALEAAVIRGRIEELANKVSDRLGGSWNWEEGEAICKAHGALARIGYDDRSISVEISLPTAMSPFRRKLETRIDEYLVAFLKGGAEG